MSSIKLKHSSGNGVSITAPSSNPAADRTLELPGDADGVIAKTDSSGNLTVAGHLAVASGSDTTKGARITGGASGGTDIADFRTNNGTIRMKINNDVTISTGNLVIGTSGKGIDFSATANSGTSELFNDYEEGTWTPSNPNGGYTFSNTAGYYTKVGNMVHWFLHSGISLVPNNNNHYEIHGLPYTSSNATHNYGWVGQVVYTANSNSATVANMRALVNLNSTYIYFHTVGLGTGARVFNSTFRNGMQGETIIVCGTYMAA